MKPATAIALSIALHILVIVLVALILRPIFRSFAFSRSIVYADLVGPDKVAVPPAPSSTPPKPAPWELAPPISAAGEEKSVSVPQPPAPPAARTEPASSPPSPQPAADNAPPGASIPTASVTGILQGHRLADAFGGMSRQQQIASAVVRFQRKAPPAIARLVREAQAQGRPFERGKTRVVLPAGTEGKPLGKVEIGPDSPGLEKTLGRVAWDKAPLPWREGIPSGVMTLEIAVDGDRVDVKVDFR